MSTPKDEQTRRDTCAAIAAALSRITWDAWTLEPKDHDGRDVIQRTGARILARLIGGRWSLTGLVPTLPDGSYMRPSHVEITAAETRTPDAIASDIARRLLPPYGDLIATWHTSADAMNADARRRQATADRLVAEGGRPVPFSGGATDEIRVYLPVREDLDGWARVGARSVRFEHLTVPPDLAVEIFQLIGRNSAAPTVDSDGGAQ